MQSTIIIQRFVDKITIKALYVPISKQKKRLLLRTFYCNIELSVLHLIIRFELYT